MVKVARLFSTIVLGIANLRFKNIFQFFSSVMDSLFSDKSKIYASNLLMLIILFVQSCTYGNEHRYKFKHLGIEQGLSNNTVHSILMDRAGFMWFATEDGLNRFDGYSFVIYRSNSDDSTSISDDFVWRLLIDRHGNLWAATNSGGLNRYNPANDNFTRFKNIPGNQFSLSSNDIRALIEDRQGNIWIGTKAGGLNKFNTSTGKFTRYTHDPKNPNSIPSDDINTLYQDRSGTIWIGTMGDGLYSHDPVSGKFRAYRNVHSDKSSLSDNSVISIYEDKNGTLWIGTLNGGLNRFDRKSGRFLIYKNNPDNPRSIASNSVSGMFEDSKGNFWITTENGGINRFLIKENSFARIMNSPSDLSSLSHNIVFSYFEDLTGQIWLGTGGGGINIYNPRHEKFCLLQHEINNTNSLSFNIIRSILKDKNDKLWIGTLGGGLNIYNIKQNKFQHIKSRPGDTRGLLNNGVTALCEDNDNSMWIGTWAGGLHKTINGSTNSFRHYLYNPADPKSISNNIIQSICRDRSGRIWIGTEEGLNLYDRSRDNFHRFLNKPGDKNTISDNRLQSNCLYQDHYGNLWAGTWNGLNMIPARMMNNPNFRNYTFISFRHEENNPLSLSDNRAISIYEDKAGDIWVGTYGGGLNKVIWDKNQPGNKVAGFKRFSMKDGLPNDVIFGILDDNEGHIWLSTNKGLSQYNTKSNTFRNFDMRDGLQGNQFFWGASYKEGDGKLYFGGLNGLTYFYPDSIEYANYTAPIVLTSIKVFDNCMHFNVPVYEVEDISLSYNQNFISFEFASLDFANPEKNQYAYKLENFDNDWTYCGSRRYASYTNLEPGTYYFRAKALNSSGLWSSREILLKITVTPPYYLTWWFRTLMSLAIGLIVLAIYKLRIRSIKRHSNNLAILNKKLKKEISERLKIEDELIAAKDRAEQSDKLKSEFLTQMSHEIRTPLNSILSFSALLKSELQYKVDEMLAMGFDVINSSGRRIIRTIELILNMSEIQTGSYACSPKKLDLYNDILLQLCKEFRLSAEVKNLDFNIVNKAGNCIITADEYSLIQIFNNLIDNAIKYTSSGSVSVVLYNDASGFIYVDVTDTGIGISAEYMQRLFQPFSQEEQGYTRRYEGNGLGLALVKSYCEINGAEIKVKSIKGKGTTFTVILKGQ